MPHTSYGLLKAIRSHRIDSPSVDSSVAFGRPNGCNQCHLDQTLDWTATHLKNWWDIETAPIPKEHRTYPASAVWMLKGDAVQRAVATWTLGWKDARDASKLNWQPPFLILLLNDPYSAVRFLAHHSLRSYSGFEQLEYDFVAPSAQRKQAVQTALQMWREVAPDYGSYSESVKGLLDDRGLLNRRAIRLLRQRDDRPITLSE